MYEFKSIQIKSNDELYASWMCITFWVVYASFVNVCNVIVFTSLKCHVEYQMLLSILLFM